MKPIHFIAKTTLSTVEKKVHQALEMWSQKWSVSKEEFQVTASLYNVSESKSINNLCINNIIPTELLSISAQDHSGIIFGQMLESLSHDVIMEEILNQSKSTLLQLLASAFGVECITTEKPHYNSLNQTPFVKVTCVASKSKKIFFVFLDHTSIASINSKQKQRCSSELACARSSLGNIPYTLKFKTQIGKINLSQLSEIAIGDRISINKDSLDSVFTTIGPKKEVTCRLTSVDGKRAVIFLRRHYERTEV